MNIVALVRKYPVPLYKQVPTAVQVIIKCLDPSELQIRKILLQPATAALHVLVQKYPQCSFHQASQRFAVGILASQGGLIIIYDLRTATKWRILDGHSGDVHAVSFNVEGTVLVSYSASENAQATVRVWNTSSGGLFSGLLGTQGKCAKIIQLPKITLTQPKVERSMTDAHDTTIHRSTSVPLGLQRSTSSAATTGENSHAHAHGEKGVLESVDHGLPPEDDVEELTHESAILSALGSMTAESTIKQLLSVAFHWLTPHMVQLRREDGSEVTVQV